MSADNWTDCPKCRYKLEKKAADDVAAVRAQYGKIDEAAYRSKMSSALRQIDMAPKGTLREDYELGINEAGKFYLYYSGECERCSTSFKHELYLATSFEGGD